MLRGGQVDHEQLLTFDWLYTFLRFNKAVYYVLACIHRVYKAQFILIRV